MTLANRCPRCGGMAQHLITSVDGETYSLCNTGLTTFGDKDGKLNRVGHITHCDTLIDNRGRVFSGVIAYMLGDKDETVKTLRVSDGRIQ